MALYNEPLIFVVISVLIVALVHSSFSTFYVFAVPPAQPAGTECSTASDSKGYLVRTCCWNDAGGPPALRNFVCQDCKLDGKGGWNDCGKKYPNPKPIRGGEDIVAPLEEGVLEQPPTPPPSGPAAPLQDGVLEQPPTQGVAPPLTRGQGALPEDGVLEEPQTGDEGIIQSQQPAIPTQPPTVEEEEPVPPCPEGQILDEEANLCVLEEPETQETEEQQGSEENGSEDNTNN